MTMQKRSQLFKELADCKNSNETPTDAILRLMNDHSSPMNDAAVKYVQGVPYGYRETNPKINFYDAAGRYRGSTKYFRTCRDAVLWNARHYPVQGVLTARRSVTP
jgi:hypothetical protein